ncbi:hypothetical protein [Limosilactobacillus reuteri]|uniref:hypothetical protein n=1 Tax=Limosilactobacillus reuteri TaxID=1598 RepID=UPI001CDBCFB0|nr:hypothetical protein [Limosilactobacillus reuteri]MCH5386204.1 hypothetical protein [Limosilactobacillus reuteri]
MKTLRKRRLKNCGSTWNSFDVNIHYGISLLEKDGMVLRLLSDSAFENHKLMWHFISYYREKILHFSELNLRKSEHLEREQA